MEYDRALFRVYERIMEDLNASPSPLALPSSSSSTAAEATGAATANAAADISPSLSIPRDGGGLRRRRRGGQQRQGADQGQDDASADASPATEGENGEPDDAEATGQQDDDDDPSAIPESERSTTNDTNNRESRRRRRARQGLRHIPILARRQFSTAMQQQRRHEPIPFVLPIWMVRKLDRMNHSFLGTRMAMATDSNSGFIVRLWSNVREMVMGIMGNVSMQHSSYDSVATSPSQQPRIPSTPSSPVSTTIYRSLSISPGAASSNNHRDDSNPTNEHTSQSDVEEGERSSLQLRLPPLNTDHNQSTPSRSSSSVVGLRRRSPSRRSQYNHQEPPSSPTSSQSSHNNNSSRRAAPRSPVLLHPRLGNSPSSSSSASTSLSSRQSGEELESTANNSRSAGGRSSAPTRALAQRAIQMQLRQNERFSSQGRRNRRRSNRRDVDNEDDGRSTSDDSDSTSSENSDDTSSSEEDGDDDNDRRNNNNEGCSQHNLYGAMRLSFAIAILHIFVLISLHVTYVGPYAFRRQTNTVSVNQRWRRLVTKMDGGRYTFVRGLLLGDEAEQKSDNHDVVDQKDATTMLVNCISYALSTRPIGDRSTYFGEEKYKSSSDSGSDSSGGRRLRVADKDEDDLILEEEEWDDDEMYYLHGSYDQLPQFRNPAIKPSLAVNDAIDDDEYDYNIYQQRAMSESTTSDGSTSETVETKAVSSPLLGKDEVLQIKIMYGGKCTGRCSRVHKVEYPEEESIIETDKSADKGANNSTDNEGESENEGRSLSQTNLVNGMHDGQRIRGLKQVKQNERQAAEKKADGNGSTTKDNDPSSPSYWEKVHYRYAIDDALLYLDEKSALLHNITVVNVTVTERCLSTGSDDGKLSFLTAIGEFLSQVYGMDSIIINQLMYGIRGTDGVFTSGYVKSMETQERWGWHKEQLEAFEHGSFMEWVLRKFGVILMSTLAFFLITSVTSLIVRVLTSSGVVLMFPLFAFFRAMGMPGADERILSLSYPWIGSARVAIANQHVHPQSHLVWAHVTKIILYYVMYEACQAAWSVVLYAKSIPEALPVWIYGFAMIWEYFSMVFVRSALSVHFFPRVTFLYFFLYHVYFYSIPYGYFDVALIPLFFFMIHAMFYTILGLEAPNSARGVINVECPREVYNRLSWPEPVAALPAEWTMFLPLNSRLSPLHDREISNGAPDNVNNGRSSENDGNAAT